MNNFSKAVFIVTLLSCHTVLSQSTFSPYSIFGIGEIHNRSMSHNMGMGEVGLATSTIWNINNMNPALLTSNTLSVFEIALQGENRTITNDLNQQKAGSASYKNLSFAFPVIAGKWTTNFGIAPMSSINYNFNSLVPIEGTGTEAALELKGNGGLTEVNFSNGVRLFKGLSIGLRTSLVFGFAEHSSTYALVDSTFNQQFPGTIKEKTNYNGFHFGLGLAYSKRIKGTDNTIGFGIIYDHAKNLTGERVVSLEASTVGGSKIASDTLDIRSDAFNLPSKYGFGVSWKKDNFLALGLDVIMQDWAADAGFGNDNDGNYTFRRTISAGVGLEITPNFNDVDSYISRIRYRIGFRYEQLPYVVDGTNIDDLGINFGWSLPVRGVSSLNMAFKFGQRGTTSNNLVKENYFKFVIGATINDRWFVRRKYN